MDGLDSIIDKGEMFLSTDMSRQVLGVIQLPI
jgi:hypothetical protein